MKLIQIPFSHNCVKVRVALSLKGLTYETQAIAPMDRAAVVAASGQGLVPVLLSDGRAIADSTAILLHLEERHPDPPLVPSDPAARAECLILEDWADLAFMAISRRIAYGNVLSRPGRLASLFFPQDPAPKRWLKERIARRRVAQRFGLSPGRHAKDVVEAKRLAGLAMARLGGRRWLQGDSPTIADVALATMSAPLAADRDACLDPGVFALLKWGEALVPADVREAYRGERGQSP
jgi:glutathione S-transferase